MPPATAHSTHKQKPERYARVYVLVCTWLSFTTYNLNTQPITYNLYTQTLSNTCNTRYSRSSVAASLFAHGFLSQPKHKHFQTHVALGTHAAVLCILV